MKHPESGELSPCNTGALYADGGLHLQIHLNILAVGDAPPSRFVRYFNAAITGSRSATYSHAFYIRDYSSTQKPYHSIHQLEIA